MRKKAEYAEVLDFDRVLVAFDKFHEVMTGRRAYTPDEEWWNFRQQMCLWRSWGIIGEQNWFEEREAEE